MDGLHKVSTDLEKIVGIFYGKLPSFSRCLAIKKHAFQTAFTCRRP